MIYVLRSLTRRIIHIPPCTERSRPIHGISSVLHSRVTIPPPPLTLAPVPLFACSPSRFSARGGDLFTLMSTSGCGLVSSGPGGQNSYHQHDGASCWPQSALCPPPPSSAQLCTLPALYSARSAFCILRTLHIARCFRHTERSVIRSMSVTRSGAADDCDVINMGAR